MVVNKMQTLCPRAQAQPLDASFKPRHVTSDACPTHPSSSRTSSLKCREQGGGASPAASERGQQKSKNLERPGDICGTLLLFHFAIPCLPGNERKPASRRRSGLALKIPAIPPVSWPGMVRMLEGSRPGAHRPGLSSRASPLFTEWRKKGDGGAIDESKCNPRSSMRKCIISVFGRRKRHRRRSTGIRIYFEQNTALSKVDVRCLPLCSGTDWVESVPSNKTGVAGTFLTASVAHNESRFSSVIVQGETSPWLRDARLAGQVSRHDAAISLAGAQAVFTWAR